MEILEQWQHVITQTETLEVDGPGLAFELATPDELQRALMALVLYSSRQAARRTGWALELETEDNMLYVYKVRV